MRSFLFICSVLKFPNIAMAWHLIRNKSFETFIDDLIGNRKTVKSAEGLILSVWIRQKNET